MTTFAPSVADGTVDTAVAEGALMNVIAVDRDDVSEFDDWYSREHFPERLSVTGFRNARRFVEHPDRGNDLVEYFSIYVTDSVDVLTSEEYLAALDSPTVRTTQAVGLFRENERTVGNLRYRNGIGRTGQVLLGRITCDGRDRTALSRRICEIAASAVVDGSAEGVAVYEADAVAASAKNNTAEGRAAGSPGLTDDAPGTIFLIVDQHGSVQPPTVHTLRTAVEGTGATVRWSTYRLVSEQAAPRSVSTEQD
ncbi:hypothetical protein [Rhodococcus sp. B10]|uniref:hypothetical protein n=1 Tax=Rhodococcus sp. B10 TaxID=2695876 RepID=UPI00142FB296|nr:hypothetical protein [Rhodococcus sp. B10]NIL78312.1 hypothetical protein [Rhodococcus sp. B10]